MSVVINDLARFRAAAKRRCKALRAWSPQRSFESAGSFSSGSTLYEAMADGEEICGSMPPAGVGGDGWSGGWAAGHWDF